MIVQPVHHALEELRGLPHHQLVAEVVFGPEFGVQALPADADRRRDGAHPHRPPATVEHHVAGRIEGDFSQPRAPVGTGFSAQVDDGHARESTVIDTLDIPVASD